MFGEGKVWIRGRLEVAGGEHEELIEDLMDN